MSAISLKEMCRNLVEQMVDGMMRTEVILRCPGLTRDEVVPIVERLTSLDVPADLSIRNGENVVSFSHGEAVDCVFESMNAESWVFVGDPGAEMLDWIGVTIKSAGPEKWRVTIPRS